MDLDKIDVTIVSAGAVLETRNCRRVQLPSGGCGAVWRGLAWPVGEDGRIDADGPCFEAAACTIPPAGFALIPGDAEAYVLLPGEAAGREAAAAALVHAGFAVLRTGRYLGDPVPGLDAEWFIRIKQPSDIENLAGRIASVLATTHVPLATSPDADLRAHLLAAELLAGRAREAALRADIARLRAEAATTVAGAAAEAAALREALDEAGRLRTQAEAAAAAIPDRPRPLAAVRTRDEIAKLLDVLVPDIILLRDSLDVVVTEYPSRQGAWRALHELRSAVGAPAGWKKLRGADGWWERHVPTGQYDTGRVYARRDPGAAVWEVLFSDKSAQTRDIAWLRGR